jgi:hypothetical protein
MKGVLTAALSLICMTTVAATADEYPSRPITMIVPFAAGGPTDVIGQLLAQHMGQTLRQNVVVEDVTGAAGAIGVGRVAHAPPDGYTLSLGHWSTHVVNGAIYKLPYDLLGDFAPITLLPSNPMLIVAGKSFASKNHGAGCLDQGPSERHHGHRGRRFGFAHRRRLFREAHGRARAVRAVSRHRSGAARSDGRAHRCDVRPGFGSEREAQ